MAKATARRGKGVKRAICPACGTNYGVPLLWGVRSEEEQYQAERGNAVLGGANLDNSASDHHCRRCRHRWVVGNASTATMTLPFQTLPPGQDDQASPADPMQVLPSPKRPIVHAASEEQLTLVRPISLVTLGPGVVVFFIAWLVGLALVGGVACSDGWASGSIGHSGACSHHGGVSRLPHILALFAAAVIAFNVHSIRERRAARKRTTSFTRWLFEDD
jgi:hypothetical protein